MAGRLFTVVGPSGAGKDTVLNAALLRCPDICRLRRVITRRSDAGGEDIEGVSAIEFETLLDQGAFALHWTAHGTSYGIPKRLDDLLATGQSVVFNGSRAAMPQIVAKYPDVLVLAITVDPAILRQRLCERGRETPTEIEARLARANLEFTTTARLIEIENSGPLDTAVQQMVDVFTRPAEPVL